MTYEEIDCLLTKVANILNERPLGVRCHNAAEPSACPVTPNLLLHGSRTGSALLEYRKPADCALRQSYMEQVFKDWWKRWYTQVWEHLIPTTKWRHKERNVKVGDIVMVKFSGKVPPAEFRMGVVLEVKPDHKGLVRTAIVGMRPRDRREATLPYKSKDLWRFEASVQRLNVFLPVEDQEEALQPPVDGSHEDHVCADVDLTKKAANYFPSSHSSLGPAFADFSPLN